VKVNALDPMALGLHHQEINFTFTKGEFHMLKEADIYEHV
jgi:hypothetical protein